MQNQPLVIKDWQNAIGKSPHVGFGLLKNVEIDTFEGALRTGKKPTTAFHTAYSQIFTADSTTDILTAVGGTAPPTGTAIQVSNSGGALPTGLAASTNYFVINLSATTFKLATTITNANAGTAIDITGNGSGTNTVATVNPGTTNHYAYDKRADVTFAIDSNGRVWFLTSGASTYLLLSGNTLTNAAGQGIAVFEVSDGSAVYLFAFRNALVDVVNVFSTTNLNAPSWTNGWKSLNSGAGSGNSHHAIVGQDNIVYFVDDRFVGSIVENAGSVFDPSSSGTYTYNNQALDLPLGSLNYWLEQLGTNLLISVSNDSYLYPWDRVSDSYGLPIPVAEYGLNKLKNIGNVVYILAGRRGNIYYTQGTYVRPFVSLPLNVTSNTQSPSSTPISWGGIASVFGNLLVGVGANSGYSGAFMITSDGRITIDNQPSTGNIRPTALFALNDFYQMGYAGGGDLMSLNRYSNFEAVMQSALYRWAKKTEKTKFSQLEIQIAAGVSGSVRVGYRRDTTSAFTNIPSASGGTTTFTTTTNDTSYQVDCGLIDIENIQVQVEMSNGIDLLEVRLNP